MYAAHLRSQVSRSEVIDELKKNPQEELTMKLMQMVTKSVMCLALVWLALSGQWTLAAGVSSDDLLNADANNSDWLMYGRTYNNW